MDSAFQIGGIASGLDTASIINKLLESDRQPIQRIEDKEQMLVWRKEALQELNSQLFTLEQKAQDLTFYSTFNSRTASSSDSNVATATATTDAEFESYNLSVTDIATAESDLGAQFSDPYAVIGTGSGSGTYTFKINGVSISVPDNYSLVAVKDAINSANAGVSATIIDGRLLIKGDNTGASNAITYEDSADVSGSTDPSEVLEKIGILTDSKTVSDQLEAASDAHFSVNGVDITRSSNDISDVINGVTFHLVGSGSATITIGLDEDKAVQAVKDFITEYNKTVDFLNEKMNEEVVKDPQTDDEKKQGILRNDSVVHDAYYRLRWDMFSMVEGITGVNNVSDVGISTGSTTDDAGAAVQQALLGHLALDEDKFREALRTDPEKVYLLFAKNSKEATDENVGTGDGTTTEFDLANKPVSWNTKPIVKVNGVEYQWVAQSPGANQYTVDTINGKIIFGVAPPSGATITATYSYETDDTSYWGVAYKLKDYLHSLTEYGGIIDSEIGPTGSINTELDELERRKADLQEMLSRKEQSLWLKFTNMEQVISRMQQQSAWLAAHLTSLPGGQ